ncbi:MAG TPA: hypothetical protein VLB76_12175 [Thermoanaerobaculia bacterium]|jgi:hypothetical protein|nr:hypothetical protein [Thermoanaerobaculia bacterium]
MPAALTHTAILLLARRRLRELKRALGGKTGDFEKRLAYLVSQALDMASTPPWPALPEHQAGDPLFAEISQFAVLGAMGPDVPAFAALLAPGQAWVFDTVHKGNPDRDREAVKAGTTDLALAIWDRGSAAAAQAATDPAELKKALSHLRAYVLGHLAHLAGDIVSHPYVNAVEWGRGEPAFDHTATEGSIDARVARQVFGRPSTREGQRWEAWWPLPEEVPAWLPAAYAEALEQVYSLRTRRPTGFAEFEAGLLKRDPPPLDESLMRDGFHVFRVGAVGIGYGWGWGHWFSVLSLLALPLLALPPLVLAAPHARRYLGGAEEKPDLEAARTELLTLPAAVAVFSSLVAAILIEGITRRGVERYTATGLLSTGLSAGLGLAFLGKTLGGSRTAAPLRWLLLGVPLAVGLFHLSRVDRPHTGSLPLVHALPVAAVLAFLVVPLIDKVPGLKKDVAAGIAIAAWTLAVLAGWIWLARRLRDARIPEEPRQLPADRPHHVRLFDDTTLFHDPAVAAPTPADLFFPSGRRKLLELWVEDGNPDLWLRSDGFQLAFSADGVTVSQVVPAPIEPVTARQYVLRLEAAIPGLKGRVAAPADLDYVLPPGYTFASEKAERDPAPATDPPERLEKLGSANKPTAIYLAPKPAQAVRFGVHGPVDARDHVVSAQGDEDGFLFVHDRLAGEADTVMDLAGDFAALLLLGGASRMLPEADRQDHGIAPIQQVFRNWNLDRRRVDEWRLLVAGGAARGPDLAEGDATARALGWVPLLRKWQDAAGRGETDVALSRGLAFLLDMTDAVEVP